MSVTVTTIDPAAERSAVLELLTRELPDWSDSARFDWLYLDNPHGAARVWGLRDGDRLVGVSAAFPRKLTYAGGSVDAWVLGDFCVASSYRSLGPAVRLQRAVHQALRDGAIDVWYDFPSRTMMAVHQRIGVDWQSEIVRLVRPLRTDRAVEAVLGDHLVSRAVSTLGNAVLASRSTLTKRDRHVSVTAFEGAIPSAVDAVDAVRVEKSAAFTAWRYRLDPRAEVEVIAAVAGEAPSGWLVFRVLPEHVVIEDLFGIASDAAFQELVLSAVDIARKRGKSRITVALTREHVWRARFEALGFHTRDGAPFIACGDHPVVTGGSPWSLMGGDRDF